MTAEAQKLIEEQLTIANRALKRACELAVEHKVNFSWSGPTYGMGGYFYHDDVGKKDDWGDDSDGWMASSHSC